MLEALHGGLTLVILFVCLSSLSVQSRLIKNEETARAKKKLTIFTYKELEDYHKKGQ